MEETTATPALKTSLEQISELLGKFEVQLKSAQLAELKLFQARRLLASLLGVVPMSEEQEIEIVKFLMETGG